MLPYQQLLTEVGNCVILTATTTICLHQRLMELETRNVQRTNWCLDVEEEVLIQSKRLHGLLKNAFLPTLVVPRKEWRLVKEQIGISVTIGLGDLLNKEIVFTEALVTLINLDVMHVECVGTLQVRDGDVEQTWVSIVTHLIRSFSNR